MGWPQSTAKLPLRCSLISSTQWDREITLNHLSSPLSQAQFQFSTPTSSTPTLSSIWENEAFLTEDAPATLLLPKSWHLHLIDRPIARQQQPCPSSSQGCHRSVLYSMVWGWHPPPWGKFPTCKRDWCFCKSVLCAKIIHQTLDDCEGNSCGNSSDWIENNLISCKKWEVNWLLCVELVYLKRMCT